MPPKKSHGQLEFIFNQQPPRVIPIKFDEELALSARNNRNKRLGKLVLNDQNKGFFKKNKGLWIPASKGEISSAVDSPTLTMNKSKRIVYEKTNHKGYARKAYNEARKRMEKYYLDASGHRSLLSEALIDDREFTEQSIKSSELALTAVVKYIQYINSFIERDWPQERWKRYKQNNDRAKEEVDRLGPEELMDIYDEAFWSVRSRMRFWHLRGMNPNEPPEVPPIPFNTIPPEEEDYYEYTND